jgi:hypothetical protein
MNPKDCTMSIQYVLFIIFQTMFLHISCDTHVTNVKLPFSNGCYKLPSGDEFTSLNEIVHHLTSTPNILTERDGTTIEIKSPAPIPRAESVINIGFDRFFHIQISGTEAEELLRDEPNGTYLVRASSSNPGEYALSVKNDNNVIHVRISHTVSSSCIFCIHIFLFRMEYFVLFQKITSLPSQTCWIHIFTLPW